MEISCVICYNNMSSTDVLYGTFCGHVFHAECVTDWMQRSATCPQCRCPVRCQDIRRIYLNFANSENSLIGNIMTNHESELEKLKMIDEKKTETITTLTDHIKKKDLEEVQHVKTIQQLHVEIQAVRRHLAEEKAKFSKEKVEMDKRISELEKMNKSAAWQTVAQMFPATDDPATLVQKIAGMKRELTLTAEKCNKLEESVAHFSKRFLDECEKNSELEKRLEICGREKLELEARIAEDKENVKPGKNLNAPKVDKDASESTIKKPKLAARTADGKSNVKYKRKLVKAEDEQNAAKSNTKSPRYNLRPR